MPGDAGAATRLRGGGGARERPRPPYRTRNTTTTATPTASAASVSATSGTCSGKTAGRRGAKVRRRRRRHMGDNVRVQDAFGILIFVVVALAAIVALATLVNRSSLYDQIGRGGLSIRDERDRAPEPAPSSAAATAERDEEIRQMLEASNERRARRGEAPLDVEAELRRLTTPSVDAGLRDEIRQLVVARNERRARQGKPPLDVDAEVERQIRELG